MININTFTVYFYAGDILSIKTDILVVSAFKHGFYPVPKTLLGDLYDKLNLRIRLNELEHVSENLNMLSISIKIGTGCYKLHRPDRQHRLKLP